MRARCARLAAHFAILGGEWYAAWTDGRGGSSDVYFQRRPLGEGTLPLTDELLQEAAQ